MLYQLSYGHRANAAAEHTHSRPTFKADVAAAARGGPGRLSPAFPAPAFPSGLSRAYGAGSGAPTTDQPS